MIKCVVLAVALIVLLAFMLWAQSDAGFLEDPTDGSGPFWYCLHADGSIWVKLPEPNPGVWTKPHAVEWCAANGYSY